MIRAEFLRRLYFGALEMRALATAKKHQKARGGTQRALVIAPAGWGSMGDAAMLNATRDALRENGFPVVDVTLAAGWAAIDGFDHYLDDHGYFFYNRRSGLMRLIAKLGDYSHFFMIGADCIDGAYNSESTERRLTLLDLGSRFGAATLIGSSFGENPKPSSVGRLRSMGASVRICARDKISLTRMEKHLERPIDLTADVAFLVKAELSTEPAMAAASWIERQRARAAKGVVAYNMNFMLEKYHPGFSKANNAVMKALLDDGWSLLLVPHDHREGVSDERELRVASHGLPQWEDDRLHMLAESDPQNTKAVLGLTDILVSGRMHAAILAAGMEVPAVCFVYAGKFEGFCELLGLDKAKLLFQPADLLETPMAVIEKIRMAVADFDDHRQLLQQQIGNVAEMAKKNLVMDGTLA